ncbi:alginate O-acetyltransferase AlgX-related protein [Pseudomonas benzenivorans]|uniref:Cell division protein FtsQ n=1 Tax=Pseudomonas benzenivorans TaxID=556533 RepID=A0ABY5H3Z3_9PSED|nr:cell division protein FtsQ [Pseudomonas benzenivorans]UTW07021.1 cell division protein FtsQ [Pseudomonas benzenivorans]
MTDNRDSSAEDRAAKRSSLAGLVMLWFLLTGLACALWAMLVSDRVALKPAATLSWQQVFEGEVTQRIARELAKVPFAEHAADLERAASWLLLGDTGSRVRQGCPGWLFLGDELKVHAQAAVDAQARAQKVIRLQAQLADRGIELLLVVVPDKSRIASDQLCQLERAGQLTGRVQRWRDAVQAAGVQVLDLTPVLQPLGSAVFLRTDTHWSELGADAAAQAVSRRIAELGVEATPRKQYTTEMAEPQARPGDLVRLAGLDWLPAQLQPAVEMVSTTRLREVPAAGAAEALAEEDLFGDSQLPNIAVIGTSFSRNSNFIAFLERALGSSVGNFAKDGGEFSGAAKDYFDSPAFKQTPPRLLVWEIPERDLQSPYRDERLLDAR